jgi:hypothetical protein
MILMFQSARLVEHFFFETIAFFIKKKRVRIAHLIRVKLGNTENNTPKTDRHGTWIPVLFVNLPLHVLPLNLEPIALLHIARSCLIVLLMLAR